MKTTPFLDAIESISIQAEACLQKQVSLHNYLTKRLKDEFGYEYIVYCDMQYVHVFLEMEKDKFKNK